MHDRRIVAGRQASAPDEVALQMSRDDLDNSHQCAPESFLGRREWLDGGHAFENSLLHQAIPEPLDGVVVQLALQGTQDGT